MLGALNEIVGGAHTDKPHKIVAAILCYPLIGWLSPSQEGSRIHPQGSLRKWTVEMIATVVVNNENLIGGRYYHS
jgi:hypothetical protein